MTAGLDHQDKEWGSFGKIDVDSSLMFDAGDPVLRFGLPARQRIPRQCAAGAQYERRQLGSSLLFCCFDRQLTSAATVRDIQVMQLMSE